MMIHDFCLNGCMEWYGSIQDNDWLIVRAYPRVSSGFYILHKFVIIMNVTIFHDKTKQDKSPLIYIILKYNDFP